jgi:hypothetical protein
MTPQTVPNDSSEHALMLVGGVWVAMRVSHVHRIRRHHLAQKVFPSFSCALDHGRDRVRDLARRRRRDEERASSRARCVGHGAVIAGRSLQKGASFALSAHERDREGGGEPRTANCLGSTSGCSLYRWEAPEGCDGPKARARRQTHLSQWKTQARETKAAKAVAV